jgi:hypothetical protein
VSMPAAYLDEEPFVDPDTLKMPESPEHRRVAELIAAVAEHFVRTVAVYRDMNWYPLDGGHAVAPDVMTLPNGALSDGAKSYRQSPGRPDPGVVVEVASATDTYSGFLAKAQRYKRLGVTVYNVTIDADALGVTRFGGDTADYLDWTGRPIPEFGNLRIGVGEGAIIVITPDNRELRRVDDLVTLLERRASHFEQRAAAMEAQLRALGLEPDASG